MPAQTYWIEEPTILAVDFSGQITQADMRQAIYWCLESLRENAVYFLVDMTRSDGLDIAVLELSSLSEWIYHPNGRWFVYVNPNRLFKNLIKMRHRGNARIFEDRQQAIYFLTHSAETIHKI